MRLVGIVAPGILCVSTLIGCFIGSGCEMKKLSNKKIIFAMDMCNRVQS